MRASWWHVIVLIRKLSSQNLFNSDRVFIREENLKVHNTVETKEKIRRVFLFNDMLLIARHKKSRRTIFKFKEAVEFKAVQRIEQQGKSRASRT